jgi:tetratricopeptide (TPR) repeat protein
MEASSPSSIISQTEAFTHEFPDSQLLSFIQLRELQAEIDANSYEGAIGIGHELLQKSPKNLEALVLMAGVLPEFPPSLPGARKANALKEAREDIQAANELLQTFHLMESYSARDFIKYKRKLRNSLDEAAASVDLVSGNYERAIQEYQVVLAKNLTPSAIIYLRLGIAYYHAGQMEKARLQLAKAVQIDKGIVGKQAANLLKQIAPKSNVLQNPPAGVKR